MSLFVRRVEKWEFLVFFFHRVVVSNKRLGEAECRKKDWLFIYGKEKRNWLEWSWVEILKRFTPISDSIFSLYFWKQKTAWKWENEERMEGLRWNDGKHIKWIAEKKKSVDKYCNAKCWMICGVWYGAWIREFDFDVKETALWIPVRFHHAIKISFLRLSGKLKQIMYIRLWTRFAN